MPRDSCGWLFLDAAAIASSAGRFAIRSSRPRSATAGSIFYLGFSALEAPFTPLHFWQAFTCVLVALALFILVRGLLRLKRA